MFPHTLFPWWERVNSETVVFRVGISEMTSQLILIPTWDVTDRRSVLFTCVVHRQRMIIPADAPNLIRLYE